MLHGVDKCKEKKNTKSLQDSDLMFFFFFNGIPNYRNNKLCYRVIHNGWALNDQR